MRTLCDIKPGNSAVISKVICNGKITRRMFDMGLVPGTEVFVQKYAPLGDPIEISLRGFNLALRKSEATLILVEPCF